MAGFNTLGSTVNSNVGGSFNPSLDVVGSAEAPPGFGIQPPHTSTPFNVNALNLSAGQQPHAFAGAFDPTANAFNPGPDVSGQHEANVAMAQGGFGNMGLMGNDPGTSYSAYGISPQNWQNVMRYLMNPQGENAGTYQGMVNTIRNSMNGMSQFSQWLPDQYGPFASDFLLRFGGPFGVFSPLATQNLQIAQTSPIQGVGSF